MGAFEIIIIALLSGLIYFISKLSRNQSDFNKQIGLLNDSDRSRKFKLTQSEYQFKSFFNTMYIPACIFNIHSMKFIQVNDKMCEVLEYPREYLIKAELEDLMVKEDVKDSKNTAKENLDGNNKGEHENTYITKSGNHVKLNWIFSDPDALGNTFCIALEI